MNFWYRVQESRQKMFCTYLCTWTLIEKCCPMLIFCGFHEYWNQESHYHQFEERDWNGAAANSNDAKCGASIHLFVFWGRGRGKFLVIIGLFSIWNQLQSYGHWLALSHQYNVLQSPMANNRRHTNSVFLVPFFFNFIPNTLGFVT